VKLIERHDPSQPMFLYLAHQAVHAPDEVPKQYYDSYANQTIWDDRRQTYAAMLSSADESIANVTAAPQERGMWNNTLVVVTTDNGGPTAVCSIQGSTNKPPRRGGKCTIWEGGATGDAFLSGPALDKMMIEFTLNRHYSHIFHAVDWFPTLAKLTGAKPEGKPLDGVSHLDSLLSGPKDQKDLAPREEVFVGYAAYRNQWYGPALRWQNWKLIQGTSGGPEDSEVIPPAHDQPASGGSVDDSYLLFDIEQDPGETNDLAKQFPIVVQILQAKLREYQESYVPPMQDYDPDCGPFRIANTSEFGPTWEPWCSEVVVYK